ncbi:hypothetical protein CPB86DRAFT_782145 [Serendipita vermifera]|nr:hypothetical protein CPB86DRAFT_782145 [Serendipita vermifera]
MFAMFTCCLRHRHRFSRSAVVDLFTDICTSTERITPVNLVRESDYLHSQSYPRTLKHWPHPNGWTEFVDQIFLPTQGAAGGWTIGP